MDVSGIITLVQTIVQLLDSPTLESVLGYKSELEKLRTTMSTVRAVLLDVDQLQRQQIQLTYTQRNKFQRLMEVVNIVDNLFDEVAFIAQHKNSMSGNRVSKEVRLFFSRFNQLRTAFRFPGMIKFTRRIMDDIAKDHRDFGLTQSCSLQVKSTSRETHSYVCEEDVIVGRDEDKRIMIDMLLDDIVEKNVCLISIVGIGGLGKTTLAQLVYNDETVQKEFPMKMWVCVSDDFNVKLLLDEILAVATNQGVQRDLNMDQLQTKLRGALDGKKYLLVLDDIWNEDVNEWRKLGNLLIGGLKGSRIVVTTRSKKVANIVGSHKIHKLEGLPEEESWNLFERMALEPGQHQMEAHLVDMGKEIVRKCANVPLAIRVIGSLLRGEGESRWRSMKNMDLANVKQDDQINGILPMLKISYYYLPVHLKSCFNYCAEFPKDYKIIKEDLICLWMAQGFIMPSDGESFEDVGEEYFMNLLQRCFFQDVVRDDNGEIESCKMHDLIHDVAKEIAGTSIYCVRHFRVSYFRFNFEKFGSISELLHMRYLDLSFNYELVVLPTSIAQLYNLQTLKLRGCDKLKELPRELRNLVNLRHLDIKRCSSLTHMPRGLDHMTNLHKLTRFVLGKSIHCCWGLSGARVAGIGELKYLNNLRGNMEIKVQRGCTYDAAEVREGGYLINKPHLLDISIYWYAEPYEEIHVDVITEAGNNSEALLQGLEPHSNLKSLKLWYYPGVQFPSWGGSSRNLESCLPNLVTVRLNKCTRLEHLPSMSQLCHLKFLTLEELLEVEYVESSNIGGEGGCTASTRSRQVFFASLEKLKLIDLPKLKGWWKLSSHSDLESGEGDTEMENGDDIVNNNNEQQQQKQLSTIEMHNLYSFSQLSFLEISECPELITFPLCVKVETLKLRGFNEALEPIMNDLSSSASTSTDRRGRLRKLEIDNVGYINSMPMSMCMDGFHHLSELKINDGKIERLTTVAVFRSGCLSSLRTLTIEECEKLKQVSEAGVWEHLTALETLTLEGLPELEIDNEDPNPGSRISREGEGDNELPWRCLVPSLRVLQLIRLPKLVKLPKGMHHLTALHFLFIYRCENLEAIPPWIDCLSSLQSLTIWYCTRLKSLSEEMCHLTSLQLLDLRYNSEELYKRCQEPTGVDWPKIQHIPHFCDKDSLEEFYAVKKHGKAI